MMAIGHALSGFAAGAAATAATGATAPAAVLAGTVTAGAALLPDLDHPNATATRRFGLVSRAIGTALVALSRAVYRATRTRRDTPRDGGHRHLTHTLVFAAATGAATHALTTLAGPVAVLAVAAVAALLAVTVLGTLVALPAAAATAAWLTATPDTATALHTLTTATGPLVALGCAVHVLGDALTESGVPLLWPIPIRGRRWYRLRIPDPVRFRVGGPGERWVAWPLLAVACVLAIPGVPDALADVLAPPLEQLATVVTDLVQRTDPPTHATRDREL